MNRLDRLGHVVKAKVSDVVAQATYFCKVCRLVNTERRLDLSDMLRAVLLVLRSQRILRSLQCDKTKLLHHFKLIEGGPFLFDLSIDDSPDGDSSR